MENVLAHVESPWNYLPFVHLDFYIHLHLLHAGNLFMNYLCWYARNLYKNCVKYTLNSQSLFI